MKLKSIKPVLYALVITQLISCSPTVDDTPIELNDDRSSQEMLNTVFDGKIFSIPSPAQTSLLLKNLNLPFQETLVNSNQNIDGYNSKFATALNIGIQGANLGYSVLYDKKHIALDAYSRVYILCSNLGIESAFDSDLQKKYDKTKNVNSLLQEMTASYRQTDKFLKETNKKDISALILTGGWIQSMYFATELTKNAPSSNIIKRLSEQKESLNSIIELVKTYTLIKDNNDLVLSLEKLKLSFDKIEVKYIYRAPETKDYESKTYLNHKTEVKVTNEVINDISSKIKLLRDQIIALS